MRPNFFDLTSEIKRTSPIKCTQLWLLALIKNPIKFQNTSKTYISERAFSTRKNCFLTIIFLSSAFFVSIHIFLSCYSRDTTFELMHFTQWICNGEIEFRVFIYGDLSWWTIFIQQKVKTNDKLLLHINQTTYIKNHWRCRSEIFDMNHCQNWTELIMFCCYLSYAPSSETHSQARSNSGWRYWDWDDPHHYAKSYFTKTLKQTFRLLKIFNINLRNF